MEMLNLHRLVKTLKRHEGLRTSVYKCPAGRRTIGYGRNLDDNPLTEEEYRLTGLKPGFTRLTKEQAETLLLTDVMDMVRALDVHIPWYRDLDPVRQEVLVNMAFNLGVRGLLGFVNTLSMIKEGRYEEAARGMLRSKWARQVKGRAYELAKMMSEGRCAD